MATLRFRDLTVPVQAKQDLLGQILDAKGDIGYLCMAGSCGYCKVRVIAGGDHLGPMNAAEHHHCDRQPGTRLACQAIALGTGDVHVEQ